MNCLLTTKLRCLWVAFVSLWKNNFAHLVHGYATVINVLNVVSCLTRLSSASFTLVRVNQMSRSTQCKAHAFNSILSLEPRASIPIPGGCNLRPGITHIWKGSREKSKEKWADGRGRKGEEGAWNKRYTWARKLGKTCARFWFPIWGDWSRLIYSWNTNAKPQKDKP